MTDITTPDVVAWRWTATYDHEVTWTRATSRLSYGTKNPAGTWITASIGFAPTLYHARRAAVAIINR